MPFIPHTLNEQIDMLKQLGLTSMDQLFSDIDPSLRVKAEATILPEGLTELEVTRKLHDCQPSWIPGRCFIGAGAYEHHIPAAIWQIASRGEFYSAYTPYQAEANQGSLQLIYEFQTMLCRLLGTEVSNASLYDGATALVEAVLMCIRIKQKSVKRNLIGVPKTLHPRYRAVLNTLINIQQDIELVELPYNESGQTQIDIHNAKHLAGLIIPQPNFFGIIEDADQLTEFAHQHDALAIAVVNPMAMAILKPPGAWGLKGADIVCGEGQPLGIPLSSGGPYFGFMCTRQELVRQLPGRIVGRTVDQENKQGFTLTLQAREQHIRRSKATSNICTNQGLMVVAASIYLSLLGPRGLQQTMLSAIQNARQLRQYLITLPGVEPLFNGAKLHEFVIRLPKPINQILKAFSLEGMQAGYDLSKDYPELENCLLVCATETKTESDLKFYQQKLMDILKIE